MKINFPERWDPRTRSGVPAAVVLDKPSERTTDGEGGFAVAVRVPIRTVVLILVVPVGMVWDALVATAWFLNGTGFHPAGRACRG